jgi:tetratricopeptide (TPR) repeat protein
MKKRLQCFLVIVVLFFGTTIHSKTASEVFDAVSSSVVVIRTYDTKGNDKGLGSGVALASDLIATNCHVVQDVAKIQVVHKGKQYLATLRDTDWDRDVCTLNVSGIKAPAVVMGSTSRLKVGARVYAIGAPQGLELTLSEGIISSLRPVEDGQYLQISAPISPGSSGGGLFDEEGRLIGLPTFYLTEGQQLNFVVPVEWITELPERNKKMSEVAQTTYIEWFNKSLALQEKKDWAGMLTHSLRWTEAQPKEPMAWYSLAIAYGETNQYTEEIKAYQQALRIYPEFASAWHNLGIVYGETGQYTEAIKASKQALSINPEDASAWNILGSAYSESGQYDEAIKAYKQALRIYSEDAMAWYNLGIIYHRTGQYTEAIKAFKQASGINSEFVMAWYNLGVVYGETGQYTEAIKAFKQALSINPEFADAWYTVGVAYYASGQKNQVIEVYNVLKTLNTAIADDFFNNFVLP